MPGPPSDSMSCARRRVDWAASHIFRFEQGVQDFLAHSPFAIIPDVESQPNGSASVKYRFKANVTPPFDLGLIAADAVHNLRAAVNNLLWGLWKQVGGDGNLSLEFKNGPAHFAKYIGGYKRFTDLPGPVKAWIENEQRHMRPNHDPSMLEQINLLWNGDKHRIPVILGSAVRSIGIRPAAVSFTVHNLRVLKLCGLQDGDIIHTAELDLHDVAHYNPSFELGVSFENGEMDARAFLRRVEKHIRESVLPIFGPYLS